MRVFTVGAASATVAVTGVGAVTGYGVVRSLRAARPDLRIVGADIGPDAVGALWCDEFVKAPPSLDESYPEWLIAATRRHGVDLLLPTIDADLDRFTATPDLVDALDCTVALNSQRAIALSRDKWELDLALVESGDPARIPSSQATDFERLSVELGLPFLVKARHGQGGRGLVHVHDKPGFEREMHRLPRQALAQQIVGTDDEEYTVGAFGDGTSRLCARVAMRRRLARDGMTRRAEVVDVPASLDETLDRLARLLAPRGPTNLQLRREGERWFLLEVNARISSSTSMRTLFGYNEAAMAVEWYVDGRSPRQPVLRPGVAARYVEDVVLDARARL